MLHDHRAPWRSDAESAAEGAVLSIERCAARADQIMRAGDRPDACHVLLAIEICGVDEEIAVSLVQGQAIRAAAAAHIHGLFDGEPLLAFSDHGNLLIFLPDIANLWETTRAAQDRLAEPLVVKAPDGREISFRLRAGMAAAPHHGPDFATLVANAKLALLDLRRRGRCGLLFFEPHYRHAATERQALRQQLHAAEREHQFVLHYQPQVDLRTGFVVGVEALMRWQHPAHGLIGPARFLEELEAMPIAARVGDWVIGEAVRQAARWLAGGHAIRTAINIFPAQLQDSLVDTILDALGANDLPPELIEIELTERLRYDHLHDADAVVGALRDIGVGVVLDDFGTGFATLEAIRSLDVSRLKIDKSFIGGMLDNRRDAAIVTGLLDLGRETGIAVVAEGVERHEQLMALTVHGCDEGQGELLGMPMPAHLIGAIIAEGVMPIARGAPMLPRSSFGHE